MFVEKSTIDLISKIDLQLKEISRGMKLGD